MGDAREQWQFLDPPNTAVLASTTFWEGDGWIQRVTHDSEDGAWQFLPFRGASMQHVIVVSLRSVVERDSSVAELADLPLGWQAWRDSPTAPWRRGPKAM